MFEQPPIKERKTTVWIDKRERALADQYGIQLWYGWRTVTFGEAAQIAMALDAAITSGVVYKRNEKLMRAVLQDFLWSFGPEGEVIINKMLEKEKAP